MRKLSGRQKQHRAYLRSEEWADIRCDVLQEANFECLVCGKKSKHNQVHHITYNNWMHEEPGDLIVLCSKHHKQAHGLLKKQKKKYKKSHKKKTRNPIQVNFSKKRTFVKALSLHPGATWEQIAIKIQKIMGDYPADSPRASAKQFCINSARRLSKKHNKGNRP